jgi:hypothetical protein
MSGTERRGRESSFPSSNLPGNSDKSRVAPPQAFLSYAWESDSHARWVRDLAERLQGRSGVRVILDQWDLVPGSEQPCFMEQGIEYSDFVIVVCTPTYAEKANNREGGVGYETRVITGEFAKRKKIESRKFIPVLRNGEWESSLPTYLSGTHGVDLRNDPFLETQYEQLIRALHSEPIKPPPIGPRPQFATHLSGTTTFQGLVNQVKWEAVYPGPCIDVTVTNSRHVIEARPDIGLEYPGPFTTKALLDTGAAVTVISKALARHCKLYQTGVTEIKTLGSLQKCGEYAAAISFPGTNLRSIDPIRIISADFIKEPFHACLIGWDILRNWKISFDGRSNRVTIID